MWFALLKNPLTKLVAEKTIGAVTHKLKKDAIIREKEIQNAQNVDIQSYLRPFFHNVFAQQEPSFV